MLELQLANIDAASGLGGLVPQAAHVAAVHFADSGIICSSEG